MDNELLLAIANLLQPIRDDIQALRGDLVEAKRNIAELKRDIEMVKQRFERLERRTQEEIHSIKLQIENEILPRLQTIEKCYTDTYYRYHNQVEGYEQMQSDIRIIQNVVQDHSKKIQMIPHLA